MGLEIYHHDRLMGLRIRIDTTIDILFEGRLLLRSEGYPGVQYIGAHFTVNTILGAESDLHLETSLPALVSSISPNKVAPRGTFTNQRKLQLIHCSKKHKPT